VWEEVDHTRERRLRRETAPRGRAPPSRCASAVAVEEKHCLHARNSAAPSPDKVEEAGRKLLAAALWFPPPKSPRIDEKVRRPGERPSGWGSAASHTLILVSYRFGGPRWGIAVSTLRDALQGLFGSFFEPKSKKIHDATCFLG
jgi:hypothetical protein